ncbi:unnamed protein product, partial [Sphacelaria rigidula]
QVRVVNLTYLQPFSPPVVVAHTKDVALFQEGKPANDAIRLMAENGDNSGLVELLADDAVSPYICGATVADEAVGPLQTWRGYVDVDTEKCPGKIVFSTVGMLVNTNDAFYGVDSVTLPTDGSVKRFAPAFDAGTEANNELCSHIPGPACDMESGNLEATEGGEEMIHTQRGVHGIGNLTAADYDWRNPVAEVFVQLQD